MVDENGATLDGDQLMALIATVWLANGSLKGKGVVSTVMSNLGFERYLQEKGLILHRSSVGDRSVLEMMRETGCNIGGEQSGHIILSDYVTTGDGLIAALQVLSLLQKSKCKVSELASTFRPVPQILKNMRISKNIDLSSPVVSKAILGAEQELGNSGRLLVRASGTEPLIRIMAQGDDQNALLKVVQNLAEIIKGCGNLAA